MQTTSNINRSFVFATFMGMVLLGNCCLVTDVVAQSNDVQLEKRVSALEEYVKGIQPGLNEFANTLQNNLSDYTKQLETGLEDYSKGMQTNLDSRLQSLDRRVVILNAVSNSYQRIDTDTGSFLIAVEKTETTKDGVKVHLRIGNPNYADYKDFKVRLIWGSKWNKSYAGTYEDWRKSLKGAEFSFEGMLGKGTWTPLTIDLGAIKVSDLEYIECELDVLGIQIPVAGGE